MNQIQILGHTIHNLSINEALDWIDLFIRAGKPHQIVTVNSLMLLDAKKDPVLARIIDKADLAVPDSSGMRLASFYQGTPLQELIPGIELMLRLCERAGERGYRIFLLGSAPGTAARAARRLREDFPGLLIAGTATGYFSPQEEPRLLQTIRNAHPHILFAGLGSPHQEKWIAANLSTLGVPVAMGIGGSLDVLSGRLRRAPDWMRRLGLEWLFRVTQEPRRLPRILRLPQFAFKVFTQS